MQRFQSKPKKYQRDIVDVINSENAPLAGVHRYAKLSKKSN